MKVASFRKFSVFIVKSNTNCVLINKSRKSSGRTHYPRSEQIEILKADCKRPPKAHNLKEGKMKEEERKTLPPKKKSGGGSNQITPTKAPDEILSSLLRLNNYDSFSSIKDESLDIDLSACVTINAAFNADSASALNGNSFSSTDFWRMLDENAQTPQLCDENSATGITSIIKTDNFDMSFEDKFLRPNPPGANTVSPMRKTPVKLVPPAEIINSIPKDLTITRIERPDMVKMHAIKLEPSEQLPDIIIDEEKCGSGEQSVGEVVSAEAVTLYKCLDCNGIIIRTPQELSTHEESSHRIIFVCGVCERDFEQEAALKKHLKSHRTVETRKDSWRKCPDCGKCLKLGSMWMHRKIHADNKKYGCDICGQKFVQKINLTHHSRVHTAEKPYECPECQKRFQERSHLQRHQKYHAQTRSYRCEKCGKMYKTERCLKVHNLVHLEQRPFACNVCNKSFISNSKLKQHSNIHTGERPFKCNYCPRDFTNFPNWLKHTRRRHKVDHKTGEQLENIPSYCSKKSTKSTKATKAAANDESQSVKAKAAPATTTKAIETEQHAVNKTTEPTTTNNVIKAPKSQIQMATTMPIVVNSTVQSAQRSDSSKMTASLPITISMKQVKVKRERKQLMPRQVQKSPKSLSTNNATVGKKIQTPPPPPPPPSTVDTPSTNLKKQNDFPDLHGLSLTSAEELIMEQALEMEECGLYDAPISIGETDNAISAEAAAALQFKIKSELCDNIIQEEFISINDANKRLLCSSLESSPYSSPASVELSATTNKLPISPTHSLTPDMITTTTLPSFYVQPFPLNAQGAMLTRLCNGTSISPLVDTTQPMQLIPQMLPPTTLANDVALPSTQALLNHFILPMTVTMQQNKQVLPSVETLLFSTHTNSGLFAVDKNTNTGTQPPTSLATQRNLS